MGVAWFARPKASGSGMVVVVIIIIISIFVVVVIITCKHIMVGLQSAIDCLCFFFFSFLIIKVHHYPLFACCLFGSDMVCHTQVPWVWQPCLMSGPRAGVTDPNAGLADPTKLGSDMIVRPKHFECGMVCQLHGV
jgi:hypothetical protein